MPTNPKHAAAPKRARKSPKYEESVDRFIKSVEIELSASGVNRFVETFDYSDQEWVEIELSKEPARRGPQSVRPGPLTEDERHCLRRAANVYLTLNSIEKEFLKHLELTLVANRENIRRLAAELHEALADADATHGKYGRLLKSLAKLRDDPSNLSAKSPPLSPREDYYREIFRVWVDKLGGGLKVGRDAFSYKLGGPLVRFFQAVTRPVLNTDAPALETISDIVGREKERREKDPGKVRRKRGEQAPARIAESVEEPAARFGASNYTDLGPFLTNPDIPFDRQVHDYVVERGRTTGVQHIVAVNADGTVLAHACGKWNGITLPGKLVDALNDPANKIVIHLNNKSKTGLSAVDIALLALPGVEAIWRHGNGGYVAHGLLTPMARAMLRGNTPAQASTKLFLIAEGIGHRSFDVLDDAIRAGKISVDRAKMVHPHHVCLALRRAGILDYRSERARGRRPQA